MRVLMVDLNNFACYPTMGVGYLVAALRESGHEVRVFSPLAVGVGSVAREEQPTWRTRLESRIEASTSPWVVATREKLTVLRTWGMHRRRERIVSEVVAEFSQGIEVVLISAYLDYRPVVAKLCEVALGMAIPVVAGGAAFTQPGVAESWMEVKGMSAVVAGEAEEFIGDLVQNLGSGRKPKPRPGVWIRGGGDAGVVSPLRSLDTLPIPDFGDFPWELYPSRLIPILASRGCAWGACVFCSDVVTSNGRTARYRKIDSVMSEMKTQASRYGTRDFLFLDLKLNGCPALWDGLLAGIRSELPGTRWSAAVHVGAGDQEGLDRARLEAAVSSGCVRLTTGLESGSQRVLDAMRKGTTLEATARFLQDAHAAGVSVRTTAMYGFPGEEVADIEATTAYLRDHEEVIDRVRLLRFSLQTGTPIHRRWERNPHEYPSIANWRLCLVEARVRFRFAPERRRAYARALLDLRREVDRINRRPLTDRARAFEGMM